MKQLLNSKAVVSIGGRLIAGYIRLVGKTSKRVVQPEDLDGFYLENGPAIFAMWHGQFLPTSLLKTPSLNIDAMVAHHGDAELIGQALTNLDIGLLRGAGAGGRGRDRGGAKALRSALQALKAGRSVILTADIPPGPARRAGEGIITIARLSGRPIIPVAVATKNYIALNTWSRFTINLPFSQLGGTFGRPISVQRNADKKTIEKTRRTVEAELNATTERAYQLAGGNSARATPGAHGGEHVRSKPGLLLKSYKSVTELARPVAPFILSRRARAGKEDPARQNERFGIASKTRPQGKLLWFHAASVGETNVVLPLIKALKADHPNLNMLLTTGTVTSAQLIADRKPDGVIHQYVPLDAPSFVQRFLNHWKPDLALLTESEIWPNLIMETAERNTPVVLINARMSKKSFRKWRQRPSFATPLFNCFDLILAQNDILARRFLQLGAQQTLAVGNLKIDAPPPPIDQTELTRLGDAISERKILLAASTHPGEDELIAETHRILRNAFKDLLTIIVPRHPDRGQSISTMLTEQGLKPMQRSHGTLPREDADIYVADTIGELGTFYSLAPISFVGGSVVQHGGQNPVEAVKLGSAILTGPHRHNFKDAYKELFRLNACREVNSAESLAKTVQDLFNDQTQLEHMVSQAEQAVDNLSGAMERTLEALIPFLPEPESLKRAS